MPNPYYLEVFGEVATAGGMPQAAAKLNVTYSAINKAMRALEEQVGGQLFERQPFKLTALGQRIYEPVANYQTLIRRLSKRAKTESGYTFVLGGSEYVMENYTLLVTEMIGRHGGDVNYDLDTCHHDEVVDALHAGRVDIAITPITPDLPADIEFIRLMTLHPVLLVPDTKEFARIKDANYFWRQGTVRERLFLPYASSAIIRAFQHGLRLETVQWPRCSRVKQIGLITQLVAAGRGVGLSVNLPSLVQHPGIRVIPLPGLPGIDYGLAWNRATREHCGTAVKVLKATADTRFRISRTGSLLAEHLPPKRNGNAGK